MVKIFKACGAIYLFISAMLLVVELHAQQDSLEIREQIITVAEQMPIYKKKGGDKALLRYFEEELMYPSEALAANLSGLVYVTFRVKTDRSTSDHEILLSSNELFNDEALRLARGLVFEIPAMQRNKPIEISYNLPIRFELSTKEKNGGTRRE